MQEFGESTLDVLLSEEREEELLSMPGIGPKTLGRIRTSARQWADSRDALGFGLSLGLSASQAYALVKKHGADSETKVRPNPYMLEAKPKPSPNSSPSPSPSPSPCPSPNQAAVGLTAATLTGGNVALCHSPVHGARLTLPLRLLVDVPGVTDLAAR